MKTVTFSRPGTPAGKGRHRTAVVGGKARMFTDAKTRAVESEWAWLFTQACPGHAPHAGSVRIRVTAYVPIPASWSKAKRVRAVDGAEPCLTKPDIDNVAKAVLDGLNSVAYDDDRRVVELTVSKCYSDVPHTAVCLTFE